MPAARLSETDCAAVRSRAAAAAGFSPGAVSLVGQGSRPLDSPSRARAAPRASHCQRLTATGQNASSSRAAAAGGSGVPPPPQCPRWAAPTRPPGRRRPTGQPAGPPAAPSPATERDAAVLDLLTGAPLR